MGKRLKSEGCPLNMTPMIDVVFQLIIFFIVTIKLEQDINEDIQLEFAKYGEIIKGEDPRQLTVEVSRRGYISIHGAQLSKRRFYNLMVNRYNRHGQFPILIRADRLSKHQDVRAVMDICTSVGIWRINFAAIQEQKVFK